MSLWKFIKWQKLGLNICWAWNRGEVVILVSAVNRFSCCITCCQFVFYQQFYTFIAAPNICDAINVFFAKVEDILRGNNLVLLNSGKAGFCCCSLCCASWDGNNQWYTKQCKTALTVLIVWRVTLCHFMSLFVSSPKLLHTDSDKNLIVGLSI